jgi:hypothetical protein
MRTIRQFEILLDGQEPSSQAYDCTSVGIGQTPYGALDAAIQYLADEGWDVRPLERALPAYRGLRGTGRVVVRVKY